MERQHDKFTNYVLGFCLSEDKTQVALIKKIKPSWQSGKLNGIGGKMEPGESIYEAMVREFEEETGTLVKNWCQYAVMSGQLFNVYCCHATIPDLTVLKTTTGEEVQIHKISDIPSLNCIENLQWLIPMIFDVQISNARIRYA